MILLELRPRRPQIILDTGCGNGLVVRHISEALPEAFSIGLDSYRWNIDYEMPESPVRSEAVQFCCADAHYLPFDTASIDAVVSLSLIEHLTNPEKYVGEIRRVLRPGGVVILQVPNLQYPIEPHSKVPFLCLMPRRLQSRILNIHDPSVNMRMTIKHILNLFRHHKFGEKNRIAVYHLALLRILPIAPSYLFVFERNRRSRSEL
jgi:ubiquinone/menaquinone biosynthesis C-methylase UbiE